MKTRSPMFLCLFVSTPLLVSCGQMRQSQQGDQAVPVEVEILTRAALSPTLPAFGTVRAAEALPVVTPDSGILRFPPRFRSGLRSGERILGGELLVEIEDERSKSAVAQAELRAEAAAASLARVKRASEAGLVSASDLSQADLANRSAEVELSSLRKSAKLLRIAAPRSGVLAVESPLTEGSTVSAGTRLATLVLGESRLVDLEIGAADRPLVRPGLPVTVRRPGSEATVPGRVRETDATVSAGGTVKVVVELSGGADHPLPGEGVEVEIALPERPSALSVPESAIVVLGGSPSIFVAEKSGWPPRASQRAVVTGSRGGGRVEILSGIEAGERVVVAGSAFLADGAAVVIAPPKTAAAATAAAP